MVDIKYLIDKNLKKLRDKDYFRYIKELQKKYNLLTKK